MKRVHLIGDSHVLMHAELISPEFDFVHCGACTAYSLMNPESATRSFYTLKNMYNESHFENDIFIFLFGEIDCRTLIYHKHKKFNIDLMDMINVVVYRYFSAISYCRDIGFRVGVHGIIPAVQQKNEYNVEFYGEDSIRSQINYEFDSRCHTKAINDGVPYFNCTYIPGMRNDQGMVPINSLLPDLVHIDPQKVHTSFHFKTWLAQLGFLP